MEERRGQSLQEAAKDPEEEETVKLPAMNYEFRHGFMKAAQC